MSDTLVFLLNLLYSLAEPNRTSKYKVLKNKNTGNNVFAPSGAGNCKSSSITEGWKQHMEKESLIIDLQTFS